MKKYNQPLLSKRLDVFAIIITLLSALAFFAIFFIPNWFTISVFLFGFPLGLILHLISKIKSKRDFYTQEFLKYIRNRLDNTYSLTGLTEVLREFETLSIDNGSYFLSFPFELRKLHQEIIHKIEILENIQKCQDIERNQ